MKKYCWIYEKWGKKENLRFSKRFWDARRGTSEKKCLNSQILNDNNNNKKKK